MFLSVCPKHLAERTLLTYSNHANEPPEQIFLFSTATIQITTVFYISLFHNKQSNMIFYKAILHNHITRNIFIQPEQNNPYTFQSLQGN